MDEHALAQRAAQGDREAFGELVTLHQARIFNAAYRMTGNRQEAEDATQEALLRAFRAIHTLDPSRPPGPWLRRIDVNVCLDRLEQGEPLPLDDSLPLRSPESLPEPQAIEREQNRKVRLALLSLPLRYRAALELRAFEELTYSEIAETLHRLLSDVKSDLFRARKLLVERLKGPE